MLGWKKHRLESRLPGEISITSDMQMTPPLMAESEKVKVKSLSCVQLFATPWNVAHHSVHGILQARILEWVARILEYFGHLMQRVDSLEKTLMLGGIGVRRRGDDRG